MCNCGFSSVDFVVVVVHVLVVIFFCLYPTKIVTENWKKSVTMTWLLIRGNRRKKGCKLFMTNLNFGVKKNGYSEKQRSQKRRRCGVSDEDVESTKLVEAYVIQNKFVCQIIDASSPLHALLPPCFPVSNHFTNALETDAIDLQIYGWVDIQTDGLTDPLTSTIHHVFASTNSNVQKNTILRMR